MPARYNTSFLDYKGKVGQVGVWGTTLNAGNIAAQIVEAQAFRDALLAMTLLNLQKESLLAYETKYVVTKPADVNAQKGTTWLVRMRETGTGNSVSFQVPGADLTLLATGTGVADVANGVVSTFIDATEAYVLSNDGIGVTVEEIVYLD